MKADKQTYILGIAKSCFYCWGIQNVSIDDIAKESGVSKKTIYSLFNSRSELVEKVFLKEFQLFKLILTNLTSAAKDAPGELMDFFRLFRTTNMPPIVIHDLRKYYPDLYMQLVNRGKQLVEAFIRANIQRGIKDLRYRKSDEMETNITPLIKLFKVAVLDEEGRSASVSGCIEFIGKLLVKHLTLNETGNDQNDDNV